MFLKLRLFLILPSVLLAAVAAAQNTIHVPTDQPMIQAGINAAVNGDTVLVAPGTYYENIDFKGKAITVISLAGATQTIIDGSLRQLPTVVFVTNEQRTSVLNGFTVRRGGVTISEAGGIYAKDSAPSLLNNIVTTNLCQGIYSYGSSPLIMNNEVDNTLDTFGECTYSGGSAVLLSGELPTTSGFPALIPVVVGNLIQDNTQSGVEDAGGNGGAGIASTGVGLIMNNTIRNNVTHGQGGGILLSYPGGVVVQNLIYNNKAGGGGGGLAINNDTFSAPKVIVANNTFADNTFGGGGGSSVDAPVAQVFLGFQTGVTNDVLFVNNIVAGSSTEPSVVCGDASAYSSAVGYLPFDHNIFYNNSGPIFSGCLDPTGTYGNLTGDPKFINAQTGNYRLQGGSPAIDAGNNSVVGVLATGEYTVSLTNDLDGNVRQQDSHINGYPIIDIGAYEVSGLQSGNPTSLLLTPSSYRVVAGTPFTLIAKALSALGVPSGAIRFYEDGLQQNADVVLDASGMAELDFSSLTPGVKHFVAAYAGQGVFSPAPSVEAIVLVDNYGETLTLTSSSNPSLLGQPVTFTVQASSTDTNYVLPVVTLSDGVTFNVTIPLNDSGTGTYTTSTLSLGGHYITATQPLQATHDGGYAFLYQQVINGYADVVSLTCSPPSVQLGGMATLSATVSSMSGTPTGSVTFTDNAAALGQVGLYGGMAGLNYTGQAAGQHTIVATYVPTGGFAGSSASCTETVTGLPTTAVLTVNPQSAAGGSPVTLTATVAAVPPPGPSVPTGTVTFKSGATIFGTGAVVNGVATLTLATLPVGVDNVTCTYSGDSVYMGSMCNTVPVTITVPPSQLIVSSSANPAYALTPVTYTVQLSANGQPAAAGQMVTLTIGTATPIVLTTGAGGSASTSVALPTGSYAVTANFAGTSSIAAAMGSLTEVVQANPTTTVLSTGTLQPGQGVFLTATVTDTTTAASPVGTVQFFEGSTLLGSASVGASAANAGVANTLVQLPPGPHTLTAVYTPGSINFLGSQGGPLQITVPSQDFSLTVPAAPYTFLDGFPVNEALTVTSLNGFADTVAMTCANPPPGYLCMLQPATVTVAAGATAGSVAVLKIDPNYAPFVHTSGLRRGSFVAWAMVCPLALLGLVGRRRRALLRVVCSGVLLMVGLGVVGCGTTSRAAPPPGTYAMTVTGVAQVSGLTHAVTVSVVVQP